MKDRIYNYACDDLDYDVLVKVHGLKASDILWSSNTNRWVTKSKNTDSYELPRFSQDAASVIDLIAFLRFHNWEVKLVLGDRIRCTLEKGNYEVIKEGASDLGVVLCRAAINAAEVSKDEFHKKYEETEKGWCQPDVLEVNDHKEFYKSVMQRS